jgi:hypothetical protein
MSTIASSAHRDSARYTLGTANCAVRSSRIPAVRRRRIRVPVCAAARRYDVRQDVGGGGGQVEPADITCSDVTYKLMLLPVWGQVAGSTRTVRRARRWRRQKKFGGRVDPAGARSTCG